MRTSCNFNATLLAAVVVVLLAAVFIDPAFSCSLGFSLPVEPIPGEHVFTGVVVGYTDPIVDSELKHAAWGLIVRVSGIVHLPPPARDEYEVYFFSTNTMCGHDGLAKDYVESKYRLGAQVQVVASTWKEPSIKAKRVILAVDPFLDSRYAARPSKADVTAESQFEYRPLSAWDYRNWEESVEATVYSFEWRKDLFRLQKTKNNQERAAIIRRMIVTPYDSNSLFYSHLCPALTKKYISDKKLSGELLNECQRQDARLRYINEAKGLDVSRLDPKLPQRVLGVWWEDLFSETVDVTWDVRDCVEIAGDALMHKEDASVCVESHVIPSAQRSITVVLLIGTRQQAVLEPRVIQATLVTEKGERLQFQSLHEFSDYVLKKGWAMPNPCNRRVPSC